MEKTYTTKQGDAWDAIAFQVYGDVIYTGFLMQANFQIGRASCRERV